MTAFWAVAAVERAESAKTAAANVRAGVVEKVVRMPDIVIDSCGARAFCYPRSSVPGARRRTKGTLAGIYHVMLPIGNFHDVTDR